MVTICPDPGLIKILSDPVSLALYVKEREIPLIGGNSPLRELVLTLTDENLLFGKIANSLTDLKKRITDALLHGKTIVYLPGSYDLVHIGHAIYVDQCVDAILQANPNLKREDLFVVMLGDDTELIRSVKASKHISKGGEEKQFRPVESEAVRLLTMASIRDVDLVGIIPHTGVFGVNLEPNKVIALLATSNLADRDKQEITNALNIYDPSLLTSDQVKPVQLWQLIFHMYITGTNYIGYDPQYKDKIVRVVSKDDTKYLSQVLFLMALVGIKVEVIDDKNLGSTSYIIRIFNSKNYLPWEAIRTAKKEAITLTHGEEYLRKLEEITNQVREMLVA